MDNLSATALAARRAGMSYGQFVALHGVCKTNEPILVDEPVKVCPECGRKFPAKSRNRDAKYCTEECRVSSSAKRCLERYHQRKKKVTDDA